jgi:hypothetical protein
MVSSVEALVFACLARKSSLRLISVFDKRIFTFAGRMDSFT